MTVRIKSAFSLRPLICYSLVGLYWIQMCLPGQSFGWRLQCNYCLSAVCGTFLFRLAFRAPVKPYCPLKPFVKRHLKTGWSLCFLGVCFRVISSGCPRHSSNGSLPALHQLILSHFCLKHLRFKVPYWVCFGCHLVCYLSNSASCSCLSSNESSWASGYWLSRLVCYCAYWASLGQDLWPNRARCLCFESWLEAC